MARKDKISALVSLIYQLWICRADRYGMQWANGGDAGYRAVKKKITPRLLARHLQGAVTIGVYTAPPGWSKWLAFDFDRMNLGPVLRLRDVFRTHGAETLLAYSGRKGYHLWLFLTGLEKNHRIRALARKTIKKADIHDVECFPAQDSVSRERPGNLIKLPLGVHRATGNRCLFVDENGQPISDQLDVLQNVERVPLEKLCRRLGVQDQGARPTGSRDDTVTPSQLRDCTRRLLQAGVPHGYRNECGAVAAADMKRAGYPRRAAAGALSAWNLRNDPPLRPDELGSVLASIYDREKAYEYGCNWKGVLAEIMPDFCVGKENCLYLDLFKEMNTGPRHGKDKRSHM
ncbi:MAG: primase C-terminal domain-containing protein [Planctomycetota bacterium]